jgi:hypothetical protein
MHIVDLMLIGERGDSKGAQQSLITIDPPRPSV